jgi:hypothetical protein
VTVKSSPSYRRGRSFRTTVSNQSLRRALTASGLSIKAQWLAATSFEVRFGMTDGIPTASSGLNTLSLVAAMNSAGIVIWISSRLCLFSGRKHCRGEWELTSDLPGTRVPRIDTSCLKRWLGLDYQSQRKALTRGTNAISHVALSIVVQYFRLQ